MSTTYETITEDEFITRFCPEGAQEGVGYIERGWYDKEERARLSRADKKRCLWTMLDDGAGNGTLVSGFHLVNRMYHVICEVPYPEGVTITVTLEAVYCTACGCFLSDCEEDEIDDQQPRSGKDPTRCVRCVRRGRR